MENANEIKKLVNINNPTAKFLKAKKGFLYYNCKFTTNSQVHDLMFAIPFEEMGEADFHDIMEAKFLLRWLLK